MPLLERKCVDWVQSDPDWCGGVSEWLGLCTLAQRYPGVHVVPHCDNFMTSCQCVASQPESLCPLAEYNGGQTQRKMSFRTSTLVPDKEILTMPTSPGLGPPIDRNKCRRV